MILGSNVRSLASPGLPSPTVPTLDLAATELGGEGLPLRLDGEREGGGPLGLKGALETPETGGVARFGRDGGNVGEKGDSGFAC